MLDRRSSIMLVEETKHELPSGGSGLRCIDQCRGCRECKYEVNADTCHTPALTTSSSTRTSEALDECALLSSCKLIEEGSEGLGSPPCNDSVASADPKLVAESLATAWNETEDSDESAMSIEKGKASCNVVEGGNATGASNIVPLEEGDFWSCLPLRILAGDAHVVVKAESDVACASSGDDGDHKGSKVTIVRPSLLGADCPLINSNLKQVSNLSYNSLPQDNKTTCFNFLTKWMDEHCIRSSEMSQRIDNSDDAEFGEVTGLVGDGLAENQLCVMKAIERPCVDYLDKQIESKKADTPVHSEEGDCRDCTHSDESDFVQFENEVCDTSHVDRESCTFIHCFPCIAAPCCVGKESTSTRFSHLASSWPSVCDHRGGTVAFSISSTCCSSTANSCVRVDNGGKCDLESGSVKVVRRTNPKRAASSKNSPCLTKYDPLARSRSSIKKNNLMLNKCESLSSGTMWIKSKTVTKKRCHSCKHPRASVWGALEILLELFDYKHEVSRLKNKESNRGRYKGERQKQMTYSRTGTSQGSRASRTASTNPLILQDIKGMKLDLPFLANSHASQHADQDDCSHNSNSVSALGLSKAVNGIENAFEIGGCNAGQLSCHRTDMENQVISVKQHYQHGDKDPESSITQETLVENSTGDCQRFLFQVGEEALLAIADGKLHLDSGTSPASDVFSPTANAGNSTMECTTCTSQELSSNDGVMRQNVLDAGSGVLILPDVAVSVSVQNIQQNISSKKSKRSGKVKGKKGKKSCRIEERICFSSEYSFEGISYDPSSLIKGETPPVRLGRSRQKQRDGSDCRKISNWRSNGKESSVAPSCNVFRRDYSSIGITEVASCQGSSKLGGCLETHALSGMGSKTADVDSAVAKKLSSHPNDRGQKLPRTKAGARKNKLMHFNSACDRTRNGDNEKEKNVNKSTRSRKSKVKKSFDQVPVKEQCQTCNSYDGEQGGLSHPVSEIKKNVSEPNEPKQISILQIDQFGDVDGFNFGNKLASEGASSLLMASVSDDLAAKGTSFILKGHLLPKRAAWVCCDVCFQWRSIPVELADIIDETGCRWTCKDNNDEAFADCAIPQEKTNAEINAELDVSDEEDSSVAQLNPKRPEHGKPAAAVKSSWILIKSNKFLHRNRKTQTIDEIMVCQCKPPLDGGLGCGDECLNRMLNIECVRGTCPCGDLCSNQQFQRHKYAKLNWIQCGKKGYGLQLLEDVPQGEFLIEYVGEVLDLAAYEARQKDYASRGQKHFYFMTLNGSEVIDAGAKGNLGRFINHSCEPNCCTEKWMVNGEVCIGLFAMRDIKKGEEVTFDYNYVRVFGAAANRCLCGSAECRGYIGGDPLSNKVFIQGDSDDKYPELAMICEDSEPEQHMDVVIPELTNATTVQHSVKNCKTAGKTSTVGQGMDIHLQSDDAFLKSSSDVRLSEISSPSKSEIGSYSNAKRIHKAVDDNQHASILHHRVKLSSSRSSFKKGSCITNKSVVQRGIKPSTGSNTQPAVLRPGQLEGVEERLNELLDDGGGISKRRDATKGYLKLLFLTATSGDTVKCEASQSTRDLSLILDAILKTTSNRMLVDIINKNGLQMLHNIMKQNGKSFNRIPILRKLLKVLEFLAVKGILTPEHINTIPSHAGVESFKDSIIKLTYHKDMQVHQIARTFRDKWLPRTIRKVNLSDRDNGWVNLKRGNPNRSPPFRRHHNQGLRDSEAICVSQVDHAPSSLHGLDAPSQTRSIHSKQVSTSAASVSINSTPVKLQKRKSRWDQPCDATNLDLQIHPEEHGAQTRPKMMKSFLDKPESNFYTKSEKELISLSAKITGSTDLMLHGIEELPPGFGSPISNGQLWNPDISTVSAEVAVGHAQARYLPQLTVSYGFPLTLVRQLSTAGAEVEGDQNQPSGIIAAGMPFHPFPPLPPLGKMDYSHHKMMLEGGREEIRPTDSAASEFESSIPSSAVERSPEVAESKIGSQLAEKMSQASNGLKRRFSQPARWNKCKYQKFGPPWPRERNGYMRNWISNEAL